VVSVTDLEEDHPEGEHGMTESDIDYLSPPRQSGFPTEWYEMADENHFWMRWRAEVALRLMDSVGMRRADPLTVLDIGSGAGGFRRQVERATAWTVDITDLNVDALRAAQPGRGRILYYDATERLPRLVRSYDAVFLFDVIEHVERPGELLAAALEHLRPGGHLVVNVPALQVLFSAYDVAQGHYRRYTRASLSVELKGQPCRLESIRYWGLALVPLLGVRRLMLGSRPSPDTMRSGFAPPSRAVNRLLAGLGKLERWLLADPPFGTSVMAAVRMESA
jgi:SAM-dependent methyltransferase